MNPVVLETRNLELSFDAVVAAADINVTIHEREILGVIGANGAGKTTLVNMITGYLKPSAGSLHYRGRDITRSTTREITRMGICRSFQIPQLFLELTVIDNVMIALTIANLKGPVLLRQAVSYELEEKARALLRRYGIDNYARQEITALPQGVRKLVDIAMATVSDPDLLCLDEPTSGVSADEKMTFMQGLIAALKSTNTTVMFIEHDMEVIRAFSPRVIALYEGRVLADGPVAEVFDNPEVRRFVVGGEAHSGSVHDTQSESSAC